MTDNSENNPQKQKANLIKQPKTRLPEAEAPAVEAKPASSDHEVGGEKRKVVVVKKKVVTRRPVSARPTVAHALLRAASRRAPAR